MFYKKNATVVVAGLIVAICVFYYLYRAPRYTRRFEHGRVAGWIKSAECTQKHKTFLAVCQDGGHIGIEDAVLADDRGHTLLANIVALFKITPVNRVTLIRMNFFINALGLWLVFYLLWYNGMFWTASLSLLFGAFTMVRTPYPGPDVPASFGGIYCLALLPVIYWTGLYSREVAGIRQLLAGGFLSFFSLFWAVLLRHTIGIIGVFCSLYLVSGLFMRQKKKNLAYGLLYGVLGIMIAAPLWSISMLISLRNYIYDIPPSPSGVQNHGISHALYVGLGTEENPWGIRWDDRCGDEAVRRRKPSISPLSKEYYREIRSMYLEIVTRHPVAVAGIYWKKFCKTLDKIMLCWQLALVLILSGILMLVVLFKTSREEHKKPLRFMLHLGVTVFLFALQGVLAIPERIYLYPAIFGILLTFLCSFDYLWLRFRGRIIDLIKIGNASVKELRKNKCNNFAQRFWSRARSDEGA